MWGFYASKESKDYLNGHLLLAFINLLRYEGRLSFFSLTISFGNIFEYIGFHISESLLFIIPIKKNPSGLIIFVSKSNDLLSVFCHSQLECFSKQ